MLRPLFCTFYLRWIAHSLLLPTSSSWLTLVETLRPTCFVWITGWFLLCISLTDPWYINVVQVSQIQYFVPRFVRSLNVKRRRTNRHNWTVQRCGRKWQTRGLLNLTLGHSRGHSFLRRHVLLAVTRTQAGNTAARAHTHGTHTHMEHTDCPEPRHTEPTVCVM